MSNQALWAILVMLYLLVAPASAEPAWHGWLVQGRDLHCSQKGRQEFSDRVALFDGKPRYRGHYSVGDVDMKTFATVENNDLEASEEMNAAAELWPKFSGKRCVDISGQFPVGDESRCYRVQRLGWFLVWRKGSKWGMLAITGLELSGADWQRLSRLAVTRGAKTMPKRR